jgi:hypothetical protein
MDAQAHARASVHTGFPQLWHSLHKRTSIMQAAFRSAVSYIEASRNAGTPNGMMLEIIKHRVQNLSSVFGKLPADIDEVTNAIIAINNADVFDSDQKATLLSAVHAAARNDTDASSTVTDNSRTQSHKYVEHYLTTELYDVLQNQSMSEEDRVEAFVDFLHNTLGIKFADVTSRKRFVSIILLCQGKSTSPSALKACYDLFTKINVKKRSFRQHIVPLMRNYPRDVKDFLALHPTMYRDGAGPVPCRLSSKVLDELVAMTPARCTNALIKSDTSSCMVPSRSSIADFQPDQVMNMMQAMNTMQNMFAFVNARNHMHGRDAPPRIDIRTSPPKFGRDERIPLVDEDAPLGADTSGMLPPLPSPSTSALGPEPLHCNAEDASAVDDIDLMIDKSCGGAKGKVVGGGAGGAKGKAAGAGASVAKAVAKGKAKAKGKAMVKKAIDKHSEHATFSKRNPPKHGTALPLVFNGCRVYESPGKYRVVPFPRESVFDKSFSYATKGKATVWANVLDYCRNPFIPSSSKNALE